MPVDWIQLARGKYLLAAYCKQGNKISGFHKRCGFLWPAERKSESQEWLRSVVLDSNKPLCTECDCMIAFIFQTSSVFKSKSRIYRTGWWSSNATILFGTRLPILTHCSRLSSDLPSQYWHSTSIRLDCFLSNSLQFITYQSSYDTDSVIKETNIKEETTEYLGNRPRQLPSSSFPVQCSQSYFSLPHHVTYKPISIK
jgi:hypothetical protein